MDSGEYIKDLLNDNKSDFAMIYIFKAKVKAKERDLISLCKSCETEHDLLGVLRCCLEVIRYYSLIRFKFEDIDKRLDEIKELRNGTE